MKKIRLIGTLLAFVLASGTVFGQNQKELVIKVAKAIESGPVTKDLAGQYSDALKWVIETDEVSIIACGGIFSLFSDKKNKASSDMTAGYTIGMAAFKLENPDKAADEDAAQLAGLNTALKAYEFYVKDKPKNKNDKVEALIVKRDSGNLIETVRAANCGKK